jgi:hypothetical protein
MRSLAISLVILSSHAVANTQVASGNEAYYLDPPSPPYCTPMYYEPNCFPFGRFRPPLEDLPVRVYSFDPDTEFSTGSIDISDLSRFTPHLDPRWWEFWKAGWVVPWK